MASTRTKCSIKNCNKSAIDGWDCDICMRPTCGQHYVILNGFSSDELPPIINEAFKNGVRGICFECLAIAELKEIEDTSDDNLPKLINREFLTKEAYEYYCLRVTGEKRNPYVFDFFMDIIKDLVKKIKKEEKD